MVEDDHGAGGPGGARWRDLTPPPASPNIILSRPSHLVINKSRKEGISQRFLLSLHSLLAYLKLLDDKDNEALRQPIL